MAELFSRSNVKPAPGGGGRPPMSPREFGGGGGGGGRGDGDGLRGLQEALQRYRLGMMFTVGSVTMVFISFTTLFVARRAAGKYDPTTGTFGSDWHPVQLPWKLLLANTLLLAVSCLLVEVARRAAKWEAILVPMSLVPGVQPIRQISYLWAGGTLAAGSLFLLGQSVAWVKVSHVAGLHHGGPAGAFVYLLTGMHALHLAGGVCALLYASLGSGPRHSLERRSIVLDVTAWYWHFMTMVWLYVMAALWLMD